MPNEIDTRISPALHPINVEQIEGYGDPDVAAYLAPTLGVFDSAYKVMGSIHDAKKAGAEDPTLTDAAKLIRLDDFATKRMEGVYRAFDSTLTNLTKSIASLEKELLTPVESKAAVVVATEVRSHLKALDVGKRMQVVREAILGGDDRVATAALGAPAMLSGLTDAMQATLLREYHTHRSPLQSKRLKAMIAAKGLIERGGPIALTEAHKAVGFMTEEGSLKKIYASDLRRQRDAAEKPFRAAG